MKIEFIDTNLHEVDEIEVQTMIVSAFQEERPFYGMAGLIDWRLCAEFSKLAINNFLTSELGEAVMTPTYGRLNATRVVLLGLGSSNKFGFNEMKIMGKRISNIIQGLKLSSLLIDLPGSPVSKVDPEKRMMILMETFKADNLLGSRDLRLFIAEKSNLHGNLRSIVRKINPRNPGSRYG